MAYRYKLFLLVYINMDACDPGVNSADLKTLLKQKLGIDLKLSRNEICDVYSSIQDGKLPLPPLVLSRDRTHMMDRKSPLTMADFDKLFSSSTKVTSIRRIAKKVGVARHADKKLTKAQLIGIIGRRLHALKVYEPIKFHSTQKTKIIRESINNTERSENNVNRGNNGRSENNVNRGNNGRGENNNRRGENNNRQGENNNERGENRPPTFSKKRPFFLKRTSGPYVNVEKTVTKTQFNKLNRALFGEKTNDEQDEFERLSKIRRVVRRGKEKFKEQIEKNGYSNLTNREFDKYWEYLMKISKKRVYNEMTGFTPSRKILPWGLFKRTPPSSTLNTKTTVSKNTPETEGSNAKTVPETGGNSSKTVPETGFSNNVKNTLNTGISTFVKKTKKISKNNTINVKKQLFNNRYNQSETLKNKYREYLRDKNIVRIIRNYQNNTKSGFFGKSKFPTLNNANKAIQNRINIIKISNSVRNQFSNDKNRNIVNRVLNNLESGKSGLKTEVQVIGKINELLTQKNEGESAKANAQRKAEENAQRKAEENAKKKNEAEAAKANAQRRKNEAEAAKANAQRRKNEAAIGKAIAKQKKIETETEIQRIKNETVTKMYRGYSTELNNVSNLNQLENIHRRYKKSKISKVWKQKLNKKYKNKKLELNSNSNSNSTRKRSSGGIFGSFFGKKGKNKNNSNNNIDYNGNNNTSNETDEKNTLTEKIQRTRNKFKRTRNKFQESGRKIGKIFVKKEKKIKVDPKPIPKKEIKPEIKLEGGGGQATYLRLIREVRRVKNSEKQLKALRREGFLRLHPNKTGFNGQYFRLFKNEVDKLLEKFQKGEPEPNKKMLKQRESLEKLLKSSKNLTDRNKYFRRLEGGESLNSIRQNAIKEIRSLADARRRKENNAKSKSESEVEARRRKENNAKAKAESEARKKKEYNNKMKIKRQMELKKQKIANNTKNRENKRRLELKKQMEAKAIEASKKAQAAKDEIIAKRKAQELEKRKRDTFKRQIQSSYLTNKEKSSYIKQVNAVADFKPLVKKIKSAMLKASEDAKKRVGKASLLEQMYENEDNMRKRAELNAKKRKEARAKIKQYMKKTYPSMSDRDRKMYANRIKNTEWKMLGGYVRGTQGMSANESYARVKRNINRNWKGKNVKLESKKREIDRKIKKRDEKIRRRGARKL